MRGGRRWWVHLLVFAGFAVGAVAATLVAVSVNVATGGTSSWLPPVEDHPLRWTVGSTAGFAAAAGLLWWAQRLFDLQLAAMVPAVQRPEKWVIDRPTEVEQVVFSLLRRGADVGITTAVHGAGGFGKTTVAKLVAVHPRVLRRFRGQVVWVTLGRDVHTPAAILEKVNGLLIRLGSGGAQPFTDLDQAREYLASVLAAGPRRLLVLDDVWYPEQEAAFPVPGRCARLVTTRIPSLVRGETVPVEVDQVTKEQAHRLLTADLPEMPSHLVSGLLGRTGRWPLLLRLVNEVIRDQTALHTDIAVVAREVLDRLTLGGRLRIDELTGAADQPLDFDNQAHRQRAVRVTIEASASLLTPAERERFTELAVFAEDEAVPVVLVCGMWRDSGDLDIMASRALCQRLGRLALLTVVGDTDGGTINLHDVIRDYLVEQAGPARLARAHGSVLRAGAADLPTAPSGAPSWWALPDAARYLREHLVEHLLAAGAEEQAHDLVTNPRWVAVRLHHAGPAGPSADLGRFNTPESEDLLQLIARTAHLLHPTQPAHSLTDVLFSYLADDPKWAPHVDAAATDRSLPRLTSRWPFPEHFHPALRRVIAGHTDWVRAVAVSPDGTWIASGGDDQVVRVWEVRTGVERLTLAGHTDWVRAVAVSPDGTWLASGSDDSTIRLWDAVTGDLRAVLRGHKKAVTAVLIAPDASWIVSSGEDGTLRVWDPDTGTQRRRLADLKYEPMVGMLADGSGIVTAALDGALDWWNPVTGECYRSMQGDAEFTSALGLAPDMSWYVTAHLDRLVIRNMVTGQEQMECAMDTGTASAIAVSSDASWFVVGDSDGMLRLRGAKRGFERGVLTGHEGRVNGVAVSPDGTWIASAGNDATVRIWHAAVTSEAAESTVRGGAFFRVVAPRDGSWVATAGVDRMVRVWDTTTGEERNAFAGHFAGNRAITVAPDGSWVAAGGADRQVRFWDTATDRRRTVDPGHIGGVRSLAVAPDGSWIASGSFDRTVRVWDVRTGMHQANFDGHTDWVRSLTVAPDGTWIVSVDNKGVPFLWDVRSGDVLSRFDGVGNDVRVVAASPGGSLVAAGTRFGEVLAWDTTARALPWSSDGHQGSVTGLAFEPNGRILATTGVDRTVRVWDTETGEALAMLRFTAPLTACSWVGGTGALAVTGTGGLYLLDFHVC